MQVIYHIGAHCTGQDRLVRSLLKNRDVLAKDGIAVPGPGRYRRTFGEVLQRLRGAEASAETQEMLLDALLDADDTSRIVLSNESFICMPQRAIEDGELYPRISKAAWLEAALPATETHFALTLRNLATFVPALYETTRGPMNDGPDFHDGLDPRDLCWSDVVLKLRDACPNAPILVWCDEDSPLLWPEIMRELCAIDPLIPLDGTADMARRLMSSEGYKKMRAYMTETPPETEAMWRKMVESFLTRFAEEDEVEQEIDLPGWSDELIEELTELYDQDLERVAEIPGVTVLTP